METLLRWSLGTQIVAVSHLISHLPYRILICLHTHLTNSSKGWNAMSKVKSTKRKAHLTGISTRGNVTRGVGLASRVAQDFTLPPDWTTEEDRTATTSKVRLRYRSPTGQYFNSLAAIQEFIANSEVTAVSSDPSAPSVLSMDESGSEYYPTPRKGLRMQAVLEESTTEDQLESPENCIFFTELRALTWFMNEASTVRECRTEGCLGGLVSVTVERSGLGGSCSGGIQV